MLQLVAAARCISVKTKVKVGDLVHVRPHIANTWSAARTRDGRKILLVDGATGVVISRLNGEGYYDVMLNSGKVIFTAYANLEVISESR